MRTRPPSLGMEHQLWDEGHEVVVGVDEVGRGAWAGPLSVGAAVLPARPARLQGARLEGAHRGRAREALLPHRGVVPHVGSGSCIASRVRRDRHGRRATTGGPACDRGPRRGARRDRRRRQVGLRVARAAPTAKVHRIVKADATCLSVSTASVLAKVTRDRMMRAESEHFPGYDFDANKGYPCPRHKAALAAWGPTSIHRRTWVFMDHLPWPGMRVLRPEQAQLFEA